MLQEWDLEGFTLTLILVVMSRQSLNCRMCFTCPVKSLGFIVWCVFFNHFCFTVVFFFPNPAE